MIHTSHIRFVDAIELKSNIGSFALNLFVVVANLILLFENTFHSAPKTSENPKKEQIK